MGRLSDALEKAGYGEDSTRDQTVDHTPPEPPRDDLDKLDQQPDELSSQPESAKPEQPGAVKAPQSKPAEPEQPVAAQPPQPEPAAKISGVKKAARQQQSSGAWDERLFEAVNNNVYIPEVFKLLRSRILHPVDDRPAPRSIMVTSLAPKEGKSFVTANLGITLAQGLDQYSLLIDCDLRRPSLAGLFGLDVSPGLVDYLKEETDLPDVLVKSAVKKLSIIPSGKPPVNPAELLDSERMLALVSELSSRYDNRILIFDSPPVQVASESMVLAKQVDGILLVIRSGKSNKPQIQKFLDTVEKEKVLGVVFNDQTTNVFERSLLKGYGYYQEEYS